MKPNNLHYERVARYLDGEDVSLTQVERALAGEIRRDEARLAGRLEANAPPGALARVYQQVLMADIRRDEAFLADRLDVRVPPDAMRRARRRLDAELAHRNRRLVFPRLARGARWLAVGLAAAAAILLAVVLGPERPPAPRNAGDALAQEMVPVEVIVEAVQEPRDLELDLLAEEIDRLEAEMLVAIPPVPVDLGINTLEKELTDFWLEGPSEDLTGG
jgi:hypothetical protein